MLYPTLMAKFVFWEKTWKKLKPRFLWIGKIYSPILALIRSFLESEEELKRIYFYASEPFTEVEPRIKGNKNKELEEYKDKNPKDYEKRVNESGIIQAFNHEIAQQNQVKLRVGRVMFEFEFEDTDCSLLWSDF
ncbi:hypothetical protein TH0011_12420 [Helicobacter pylori]